MRWLLLLVCCACATTSQPRVATLRERAAPIASAKGDIRDVYRKVAPATVVVRGRHGFGTGVIIDARGFVLTNHHVIADAQTVDFKRHVTVELGILGKQGYMQKRPGTLTAWVLKSDPLIDLAVLKLDTPPEGLAAVKLAETDPVPGEPVAALGHGGIGLLWAIRDGEVASVGKLASSSPQLASSDPPARDEMPALVIQSSCAISPGDSGGPLVNRAGELVGVNAFMQIDPTAPVAANFHVHVAEVREFLKAVPSEPVAQAPRSVGQGDPVEQLDADGDGIEETRVYETGTTVLVVSDLGGGDLLAVTNELDATTVFHAGRFVVEAPPGSGRGAAYSDALVKQADHAPLLDRSTLGKAAAARFDAIERGVLNIYGMPVNEPLDVSPDPYAATKWKLFDADQDKKPDSAFSGQTVVIDPKQTLSAPIAKAPIAFVRRQRRAWCTLGDRVLPSEDADSGAVTEGDEAGQLFASLATAGLTEPEQKRVRLAIKRLLPRYSSSSGPWPHPIADVGNDVVAEDSGVAGLQWAIVSAVGTDNASLVVELDRDAVASTPAEMERRARKGQGVDLAWVRRSDTEWFLYDTDRDGTFDVALFQAPSGGTRGFRYANGVVTRARELDAGRPVRPKLFADEKQRSALAALAKVFFNPEVVEP